MSPAGTCAHRTRMGMVFQHFYLFPHRRVIENVIEGPVQVLGRPIEEARRQGEQLLAEVGLAEKTREWPARLSGGQKQRVAIARALAMRPSVLLLDEVTSALDVEMIAGINDLLAGLAREGMTMVVVTHDLGFAREVADRICFLEDGRIIESGPAAQLLAAPRNDRLKSFLDACLAVLPSVADGRASG
jgi:polar amino acid transport system ATP-binding protein